MGVRDAIHNTFMLTSQGVKRFGLWDENIYYAFCEGESLTQAVSCRSTVDTVSELGWA